jgi:N-acetylglutamate synthase-like GNAT family acetyltransferase
VGSTISRVFIDPKLQHLGHGKLIMFWLEKKAKNLGLKKIKLSASLVSKKFYNSLGYTTIKANTILCENNQELNYFEMEKDL